MLQNDELSTSNIFCLNLLKWKALYCMIVSEGFIFVKFLSICKSALQIKCIIIIVIPDRRDVNGVNARIVHFTMCD